MNYLVKTFHLMLFALLIIIVNGCKNDATDQSPKQLGSQLIKHGDFLIDPIYRVGVREFINVKAIDVNTLSFDVKAQEVVLLKGDRYNLNGGNLSIHRSNSDYVLRYTSIDNTEIYTLNLSFAQRSVVFSERNKIIYSNRTHEVLKLSKREEVVFALLTLSYIQATDDVMKRIKYFQSSARSYGGCQAVSFGFGMTQGAANNSAEADRPDQSCQQNGDPGSVCATGVWGGDLVCMSVQQWSCSDDMFCWNPN